MINVIDGTTVEPNNGFRDRQTEICLRKMEGSGTIHNPGEEFLCESSLLLLSIDAKHLDTLMHEKSVSQS